jgi:tRNA pseudouridine55 synthase
MNPYILGNPATDQKLSKDLSRYPDGIVIVLDKPYGWTSADAVRKIKFSVQRWFGLKNIKVGHAGTLDPLATGILLICIGKATKYAETLQSQKKEYVAEITFGATTPSYDLEKEIDATYPYEHITAEGIKAILPAMTGETDQIPPIFSAKLINGKRAYELAREGKNTEMKPSKISIYNLELISWNTPVLKIAIECSKGTYIRSFARDIGLELNSGAHLSALIRTASGDFRIEDAINMDNLKLFLE